MARTKSTTQMMTTGEVSIASIKTLITRTVRDLNIEKTGPRNGDAIATPNTAKESKRTTYRFIQATPTIMAVEL